MNCFPSLRVNSPFSGSKAINSLSGPMKLFKKDRDSFDDRLKAMIREKNPYRKGLY